MATAAGMKPGLPSGTKRRRRRSPIITAGAAMIGTVAAIWFGLATLEARHIVFPAFYIESRAHRADQAWTGDPALKDPESACGASFENVTLTRRDGLKLAAWFVPASKPAAVILLHGAGGSRHAMLPYLKFLHSAGYSAMIVDELDSGDSYDVGRGVGYGWREREDVLAAAAALKARGFHGIGALGVSQGAAAAILAQADAQVLHAIVSDSSYANLGALLRRLPTLASLHPTFLDTILWESSFWIGRSPDRISPAEAAAHLDTCALLVIQGSVDRLVPVAAGQAIYDSARGAKEIWIVPKADHTGALSAAPDEYARRVTEFFDRYLLSRH